jgi:hypothetical protein
MRHAGFEDFHGFRSSEADLICLLVTLQRLTMPAGRRELTPL